MKCLIVELFHGHMLRIIYIMSNQYYYCHFARRLRQFLQHAYLTLKNDTMRAPRRWRTLAPHCRRNPRPKWSKGIYQESNIGVAKGLAKLLNANVGADHKQKVPEAPCHCWRCTTLTAETAYGVCKSTIHVRYTPVFCAKSFQAPYREPLVNHPSKIKIELCALHGLHSSQICAG